MIIVESLEWKTCADSGIFVGGGGGGGPGQSDKKALTMFGFFCQGGGVQLFPGGGGSNCLFPIETHITCDFPG